MSITRDSRLVTLDSDSRLCDAILRPLMSNPSVDIPQPVPFENDLLDPFEKLVTIEVLGRRVEVPEKNRILRCFQYLSLRTISYGDFCWNGECTNCQSWYRGAEQDENCDRPGLACRMEVIEEMVITKLSPFIKLEETEK